MTKQAPTFSATLPFSSPASVGADPSGLVVPGPGRTLHYLGGVSHQQNERLFEEVKTLLRRDPAAEIALTVSSPGGPTGVGMCFFDTMRFILRPRLVTLGTGDVDSSGLIVFLSGTRRYISVRTTVLLHLAGRRFDSSCRFTAQELLVMAEEDKHKDEQYAALVAAHAPTLTKEDVLDLMKRETILTPHEMVALGLAHGFIA